jgi:DNA-3-methyladenine glycosylase II
VSARDAGWAVDLRVEVRPRWHFRMPRFLGRDGLAVMRGGVLQRLIHCGTEPVVVRVARLAPDRLLFGAQSADRAAAEWGVERMRFALGADQDLREFHDRFRFDPFIGAAMRADPGLRIAARPDPFEALTWAICEQLIEYDRASAIQRRLIARLADGGHARRTGTRGVAVARPVGRKGGRARALRTGGCLRAG